MTEMHEAAPGDGAEAPPEPPIFDPAALDGLRAAFGARITMLLERTRDVLAERVAQIAPLSGGGASQALGRLAHEVGGMAGQVGLARLRADSLALEALCEAGAAPETVRAAAERLTALASASLEALPSA